jgi:hypothetical protein
MDTTESLDAAVIANLGCALGLMQDAMFIV